MQIYILLSVLVTVIGALMYLLCASPKLQEFGRLAYFAGLVVFLLQFGPYLIGKG